MVGRPKKWSLVVMASASVSQSGCAVKARSLIPSKRSPSVRLVAQCPQEPLGGSHIILLPEGRLFHYR